MPALVQLHTAKDKDIIFRWASLHMTLVSYNKAFSAAHVQKQPCRRSEEQCQLRLTHLWVEASHRSMSVQAAKASAGHSAVFPRVSMQSRCSAWALTSSGACLAKLWAADRACSGRPVAKCICRRIIFQSE